MLEAAGSKERESATATLSSYLHHLSVFSPLVRAAAAAAAAALASTADSPPDGPWHASNGRPAARPRCASLLRPQAALTLRADWEHAFPAMRASLAAAQLVLLQRVGWRTRLAHAELAHCRHLLFHIPPTPPFAAAAQGAVTAQTACQVALHERRRWAVAMHKLQAEVLGPAASAQQLQRLADAAGVRAAERAQARPRCQDCSEAPSKRARCVQS